MHEAVQRWAQRGDREVLLPSGQRVKVRLRSAIELLREGNLPETLRRRAMEYETGGIDSASLSPEERISAYDFMRAFIARSIVAIQNEQGTWEPQRVSTEELAELPEDDISALQAIVTLRKTTLQVTAESEAAQGRISDEELAQVNETEAGATVDGWAEFRGGPGGDPDGADGGPVREVAGAGLPPGR